MPFRRSFIAALAIIAVLALFAMPVFSSVDRSSGTEINVRMKVPARGLWVPDGLILPMRSGFLRIQLCAPGIVRMVFAKDARFFAHPSLMVAQNRWPAVKWTPRFTSRETILSTSKLDIHVGTRSGTVSFYDKADHLILAEAPNGHMLTPAVVQGVKTYNIRQQWLPNVGESLYGLGQHQLGLMDIKGYDMELWQHNGTVVIPFLVSSKGYGILWDNNSYSRFGDLRDWSSIPAGELLSSDGNPGGLTASYYRGAQFDRLLAIKTDSSLSIQPPVFMRPPAGSASTAPRRRFDPNATLPGTPLPFGNACVRWQGFIAPKQSGSYLFRAYSNGGIKLWVDGRLVMNHWRQSWLPWKDIARIPLQAGHRYAIKLEWVKDQGASTLQLQWKTPSPSQNTSLWSQVGDGIDYYFVYGPKLDSVIDGYRKITGTAPMMPKWAFGLWQSRQRYETQQQSLDVVKGFRARHIPFDNIVQDWFYWPENAWGSHQFDPVRFPDPNSWIRQIHQMHAHLMISVWPKFYPGTANFTAMNSRGFLYQPNLKEGLRDWVRYPYTFYDAFSAPARKLYWQQMDTALFVRGVDAWWMDATEPDLLPQPTLSGTLTHMTPTALGPASRVLNAYALENSRAVYEGQRAASPNQRVFILTRSGFAGQQRYAAAPWSGDITSTWTALRKQISAGLGFCISGMPYWTMDIGGFSVPARFSARNPKPVDLDEWRELNARWFEFGAFVPLLRAHGESPYREMWEFGGESSPAYRAELKFDRLRYRLLPYIYSLAGNVTQNGGTIMRPLVMDFPNDPTAREVGDQYLFGPAFLVSPISQYKERARTVYLPAAEGGWYDFWTGKPLAGGRSIESPAAYDAIPLHVRAGSIIPFGPDQQYVGEKPADPITLYVYTGADGSFTLYDDDGLTYNYERGAFTQIPFRWNDRGHTLTIGERQGSYPGMLARRTFQIVLISPRHPAGFSWSPSITRIVSYTGHAIHVHLPLISPVR
ncbi:MAG TPA: TIM-barrel domain-containing protein [Capsulimonadaceae bacterium]|nr:TIM-barrel domain-containing protein [Capsulimonadaceae bacterium]